MINNEIYLRRKSKVYVDGSGVVKKDSVQIIATLVKNIESLGYILDPKLFEKLLYVNLDSLTLFYKDLVKNLKKMVGAHVKYEPMYPNFPRQVMEMSEVELYINAILHYFGDWIGVRILPKYKKEERPKLELSKDLKNISLGNEKDFQQIFYNLLNSKTSLSQTDYDDLTWYFESGNSLDMILPEKIHHKEILAFVASSLLKINKTEYLTYLFKTATDILRFATALSDGDISLATNTKFKHFSRKERKTLLLLIEKCKNEATNIVEDMFKYRNKWLRLGEILHPGEYWTRYPKAYISFFWIRNSSPFLCFNSKVEKALLENDALEAVSLLKTRPGEFARRLDHLFRTANRPSEKVIIFNNFITIVHDVSTPVLLQLIAHFKFRNKYKELRIFFPKGNLAKSYSIENKLPLLNKNIIDLVIDVCRKELINRFRSLQSLDKVFIDKRLQDYVVPLSQRSASKSLLTISRFSKLSFREGNTLRFFLWWHDIKRGKNDWRDERVDIDLSAVMYDNDWKYLEHVSYTNLRSSKYKVVHSGDITSAPNGACEFLDIDVDSVLKYGGRYIVISLNSYSEQPYVELPECFAGWMVRKEPQSGEIFEPKTVENKVDLTADTKICIPVIIDLLERKIIWLDLALKKNPQWYNNIEGNQRGMVLIGKGVTTLHKPNLYELFTMHGLARGKIVNDKEEADTVFSLHDGLTPYDIDVINSEYL